mgnify:FL=1
MIAINKYTYREKKEFIDMYSKLYKIEDDSLISIIEENNKPLGFIIIKLNNDTAILEELFIKKDYRHKSFGDGLLRAALNSLRFKGINRINYLGECKYLLNKGFSKDENVLKCDIEKFFSNCQCSKGGKN